MYEAYKGNGIAKQLRTKMIMKFKSFEESMSLNKDAPLDPNLAVADFEKLSHHEISHLAFATLDTFMQKNGGRKPASWSIKEAINFFELAKGLKESIKDNKLEELKLLFQFALTS